MILIKQKILKPLLIPPIFHTIFLNEKYHFFDPRSHLFCFFLNHFYCVLLLPFVRQNPVIDFHFGKKKTKKIKQKTNHIPQHRYKILAAQAIAGVTDPQKVAKIILESTGLDPESYRLGNSKA